MVSYYYYTEVLNVNKKISFLVDVIIRITQG